jgi:hypothetical protein
MFACYQEEQTVPFAGKMVVDAPHGDKMGETRHHAELHRQHVLLLQRKLVRSNGPLDSEADPRSGSSDDAP